MDTVARHQFLEALRSDPAFLVALRREIVGEELIELMRSANDAADRAFLDPGRGDELQDLRHLVNTLIDVAAMQRRDIDALTRSCGTGKAAGGADGAFERLSCAVDDLAAATIDLGLRVDALDDVVARNAQEIETLSEDSTRILPLVEAGFGAARDALAGMLGQLEATQQELDSLRGERPSQVLDLREDLSGARPNQD